MRHRLSLAKRTQLGVADLFALGSATGVSTTTIRTPLAQARRTLGDPLVRRLDGAAMPQR